MKRQLSLNPNQIIKLKGGKWKCEACGRNCQSYKKTLDERLITNAYKALDFLFTKNRKIFRIKEVFDNYVDITDFQKLHYFGVVRKSIHSNYWRFTQHGLQFLLGNRLLPRFVWVFRNSVIDAADELVSVDKLKKRWQVEKADYTMEYRKYFYKISIKQSNLL